jgi:transposase
MNNSALCIDVSKSSSYANGFVDFNKPYSKPISFAHTPDGLACAYKYLLELETASGSKPHVVLEATGNYSKPIVQHFQQLGYKIVVLNPLQTSTQKRKNIRKVKTDPIDTYRIAQVYYTTNNQTYRASDTSIEELRILCRQWDEFTNTNTQIQLRFRSLLQLVFPKYDTVFDHISCDSSLRVLSNLSTPESVLSADREYLFNLIKIRNISVDCCNKKVEKLLTAARESLPYNAAQQPTIRVLNSYIRAMLTHKEIMADIRAQIDNKTKLSQDFSLLLSIPGVGEITAATILGEIGNIENFESSKQLIAYAGIDPSVFQSGSFRAKNNKISKRGSTYLRKALYQAVSAAVRKRPNGPCNPVLYEYYSNKINSGKSTKVALVATCNKLLRIIFGILKSKTSFKA